MQAEELAQQGVMNLSGLIVLTAIPVVAFALWCDYFERFFKSRLDEREPLERGEELYRVRSAGFFITLFQLLIFFGTTPVRREHPLIAYPIFFAAFLIQLTTQRGLESKIIGSSSKDSPEMRNSLYWQALRTFFWSLAAGTSYVSVILISVLTVSTIGVMLNASIPVKIALLLFGMSAGIVGGLTLSFALGAFFVRRIMCATPLREGDLHQKLSEEFANCQAEIPEFWSVDMPQFHLGSVMMAGFPGGRGIFKPGFFISSAATKGLSPDELRSVVLHEISHWKLRHLKKRFVFAAGMILCASLLTGMAVLCSRLATPDPNVQGIVGCIALVICFAFSFRMLAQQVRFQEIAADIHSIEKLGSDLAHLASALRTLDRINDTLPLPRDPGTTLLSLGHPATEKRIRILEKYFEKKAVKRELQKAA